LSYIGKLDFDELVVKLFPKGPKYPYGLGKEEKSKFMVGAISELTRFHAEACEPFGRIIANGLEDDFCYKDLSSIPFLPVNLFKSVELKSIEDSKVQRILRSSGTSGHKPSKIYLDSVTAKFQTQALFALMKFNIDESRRPMAIIDSRNVIRNNSQMSARAAGIAGFSIFGRKPVFCLDEAEKIDLPSLEKAIINSEGKPMLIFGFTYLIWRELVLSGLENTIKFPEGSILLHGGGWKRVLDDKVSPDIFKDTLKKRFGISKVINYYGMVEQVGSIYFECDLGYLHAPDFSEIIVRDQVSLEVAVDGAPGIIQTLSTIQTSYPGHSLLTEDVGIRYGSDACPCGRLGTFFKVLGRLPKSEARGCSDTGSKR
jgi:hypothetical protein